MSERYYITCDMEGITGITNFAEMEQQKAYTTKMMTAELREAALAITEARVAAGAERESVEITAADSHSLGVNMTHGELPSNVKLIRGFPRHHYMAPGLEKGFDAIFFLGYHARIGTAAAGMDHTFSGSALYAVEINGREVGEFEINAGLAGHYGIPVAFASGDDKFVGEIAPLAEKYGFETLVTKEAISRYSAVLEHPDRVYKNMRSAIRRSLDERRWAGKPMKFEYPLKARLQMVNTVKADLVSLIPVVERTGGREISFTAPDFPYFYDMLCAALMICWSDK